jgi:hypothetical protein
MPELTPRRIRLLRDLGDDHNLVPSGTPGIRAGRRFHFDLGYILQHGRWAHGLFGPHGLPTFELLEPLTDYEDLGEFDGTQGEFTDVGWGLSPIAWFRPQGT